MAEGFDGDKGHAKSLTKEEEREAMAKNREQTKTDQKSCTALVVALTLLSEKSPLTGDLRP